MEKERERERRGEKERRNSGEKEKVTRSAALELFTK